MSTIVLIKLPRKFISTKSYKFGFHRKMSVNNSEQNLKRVFMKSINAVRPGTLLEKQVKLTGHTEATLRVCGDLITLRNRPVRVIGFGKAVLSMAEAVDRILGACITDGVLIAPVGSMKSSNFNLNSKFSILEGAKNNIADANSVEATKIAFDYVCNLTEADLLLVLISGGGSALLSLPLDGVDYNEKANIVRELANRGARIDQMNAVRKKLSAVKGGRLAQAAQPTQVVALTLSDVIGDRLDVIASGPTVPNMDSEDAAKMIIEKFGMKEMLSPVVHDYIYNKLKQPNDANFISNTKTYIIGNNKIAAEAAAEEANLMGYETCILCTTVQGDVVHLSKIYIDLTHTSKDFINGKIRVEQYIANLKDICSKAKEEYGVQISLPDHLNFIITSWSAPKNGIFLILAGEPTVHVSKNAKGVGGRSQHLALLFSKEVAKSNMDNVWLLCGGTDGVDGPTDAAGAIVSSNLVRKSGEEGLDINKAIDDCDSYGFLSHFQSGDNLIKIGHTGTNVMDLHFLLIKKDS